MSTLNLIFICISAVFSQTGTPEKSILQNSWEYYFKKGKIQYDAGMYDYSYENMRNALAKKPDHYQAANMMAEILLIKNEKARALDFFEESLKIKNEQPDILYKAAILHELFTHEDSAMRYLQLCVKNDPSHIRGHSALVRFYIRNNDSQNADRHYRLSRNLGEIKAGPLYEKAAALRKKGKYGEATDYYRRAIEESPLKEEACFELADTCRYSGKNLLAAEYIEKLLTLKPDIYKGHMMAAHIYFTHRLPGQSRKFYLEKALKHLHRARELQPRNAGTYELLAEIYEYMGKDIEAEQARKAMLELEGHDREWGQ